MNRNILSGAALSAAVTSRNRLSAPHFGAFGGVSRNRVFFDKENEFTGEQIAKMTEPEFRKIVLEGTKSAQDKVSSLVTENSDLKAKCEAAFKDIDAQKELTTGQAQKIVTLERSLLSVSRQADPNESTFDFLRRAFPDECKRVGEMVKAAEKSFSLVQKAESTASQPTLGAPQFDNTVYSRVTQYGAFKALDVHPMGAQTENMIVETDEPVAVFIPENGVFPETAIGLEPVGMTAKKMGCLLGVSGELLQDSLIDLGAYVVMKFARACAKRADYAAFMSDGTNDAGGLNGGFLGLFNAGTAVSLGAGHTTLANATFDEINEFCLGVGEAVLGASPRWFMNTLMLARFMGIKDGNGRPIFLNALEAPAFGSIGTINGFPVSLVSVAPNNNSAGQAVAAFGDPMAYSVGIRLDYQFDYSDHARFTSWQRVYRALMRAAFKMKVAANIHVLKTAAA